MKHEHKLTYIQDSIRVPKVKLNTNFNPSWWEAPMIFIVYFGKKFFFILLFLFLYLMFNE
tara:strand:+ start:490 stop:669 length:180 start_codon:yes stop_codon:yes gene_type:complete